MKLTLTVVRCPTATTPEARVVTGGEFTIGRGPGVDWVLADGNQLVSRRHCTVLFRAGVWQIIDDSANGTFRNSDENAIGKGNTQELRDHDRLRVGPYEIEITLSAEDAPRELNDPWYGAAASGDRFDDIFNDPLGPTDAGRMLSKPFSNLTQEDHSSALNDALRPPNPIGHMPLHTGGLIPADDLLSEDWEKDLLAGMSNAAPAANRSSEVSFSSHSLPAAGRSSPVTPPPPVRADNGSLLGAFLSGVGLPDAQPSDPAATLHRLGEAFRALVTGLRAVLITRASIKSEFRIEQTLIRARGNNPLKFSANDDDAVAALLGVGRRTDMAPAKAITDALRDIRLHELAATAAMQSAMRALLKGLDPDAIRKQVEQENGKAMLPVQRKARAWDAYVALHGKTVQALSDDFDSIFGKAFARAYEDALEELAHEKIK